MTIKEISFNNFRNLKDGKIEVSDNINVICGDNAQGKTNLLECIWLFNGVRSFRGSKDTELISFDNDKNYATTNLKFFLEDRIQEAQINIFSGRREAILNGIKKKSASQIIGKCTSVVFSPEHLNLVKSGPSERRRFLDGAICRLKINYAVAFSNYKKILNQRNALLKDINKNNSLKDTIEVWNENLAKSGAFIILERFKYIELLKKYALEYHSGISKGKEKLDIIYNCNCNALKEDDYQQIYDKLLISLQNSLNNDLYLGCTNIGPHRDDLDFLINDIKSKTFASQGQQRSIVLSLKLSEASILEEITYERPVILLDDVLSELDIYRQDFLLNKIENWQVFITCCDVYSIKNLKNGKVFNVKNGTVIEDINYLN